jgi:hypothetical protein
MAEGLLANLLKSPSQVAEEERMKKLALGQSYAEGVVSDGTAIGNVLTNVAKNAQKNLQVNMSDAAQRGMLGLGGVAELAGKPQEGQVLKQAAQPEAVQRAVQQREALRSTKNTPESLREAASKLRLQGNVQAAMALEEKANVMQAEIEKQQLEKQKVENQKVKDAREARIAENKNAILSTKNSIELLKVEADSGNKEAKLKLEKEKLKLQKLESRLAKDKHELEFKKHENSLRSFEGIFGFKVPGKLSPSSAAKAVDFYLNNQATLGTAKAKNQALKLLEDITDSKTKVVTADGRKLLIDGQGNVIKDIGTATTPTSDEITKLQNEVRENLNVARGEIADIDTVISSLEGITDDEYGAGAFAAIEENFATLLGDRDVVSFIKTKVNELRTVGALDKLPPGAASDADVALVMNTQIPPTAGKAEVLKWLRGMSKVKRLQAKYNSELSRYVAQHKDSSGFSEYYYNTNVDKLINDYKKTLSKEGKEVLESKGIDFVISAINLANKIDIDSEEYKMNRNLLEGLRKGFKDGK